jgi:hypothetical protein
MGQVQAPIWMVDTQWRDTGRQVKVGPLDGRLMLFVILLMLFPSMILFGATLLAMAFFYGLEYIGYTLPNAYRKLKVLLSGKRKNGVHYWRQHKFKF